MSRRFIFNIIIKCYNATLLIYLNTFKADFWPILDISSAAIGIDRQMGYLIVYI